MLAAAANGGRKKMAAVVDRRSFLLPREVAREVEIFAVGDIHGRPDLLRALLDEAAREPRRRDRRVILFLGDIVDRGPDSLGAIDLAIEAAEQIGADESIYLMGNHEAMMRLALDPKSPWDDALDALETWLFNGGGAVVRQFAHFEVSPPGPEELLTVIRVALPERVRDWLWSLKSHWRSNQVLFVHAGVNPRMEIGAFLAADWNTPLAGLDQERHWAWIRWPFLEHQPGAQGFAGLFVVHGHTPNDGSPKATPELQIARFRLNLDVGSGLTGMARMGIFRGAEVRLMTALGPTNRMLAHA